MALEDKPVRRWPLDRVVGRDRGIGRPRGVCGGYGVRQLIFELRMSRDQRDGCLAMLTFRLDPSSEARRRAGCECGRHVSGGHGVGDGAARVGGLVLLELGDLVRARGSRARAWWERIWLVGSAMLRGARDFDCDCCAW